MRHRKGGGAQRNTILSLGRRGSLPQPLHHHTDTSFLFDESNIKASAALQSMNAGAVRAITWRMQKSLSRTERHK
jgi:hypothetical protein